MPHRCATRPELGTASPKMPMRIVVALRMRHVSALTAAIRSGRVLTASQFAAAYSPTTAQVRTVESYLQSRGFTVAAAENRLLLTATGTAGEAASAFHTRIARFRQHGHAVFANTTVASVPASLASSVGAVLGLNDASRMTPAPHVTTSAPSDCAVSGAGYPCTYNPSGLWKAYDAPKAHTGAATSIAIFAQGRARRCGHGLAQRRDRERSAQSSGNDRADRSGERRQELVPTNGISTPSTRPGWRAA